MRKLPAALVLLFGFSTTIACGLMGGGLESEACKTYFEQVEACAAKADAVKAGILRKTAEVSKENFKKNSNPLAVQKSCEMMLDSLKADPDCKSDAK